MNRTHAIVVAATTASAVVLVLGWILWSGSATAESLQREFEAAYAAKLANPDYVAWKSSPGLPSELQRFPQEAQIKRVRSRLAALQSLPSGAHATAIPVPRSTQSPQIDGRIESAEWAGARSFDIGVDGKTTTLYLVSDGAHLYLACDVPSDTTGRGYDQFRFYVHVGLAPALDNERIHVRHGTKRRLGGIRQTNVRWKGRAPVSQDERWMKYDISDWQIYEKARGLGAMHGHRQYEAVIDLEETGLHPGVPFRAWVQVETDPALDDQGKFDYRVYAGQYGSQDDPHWFIIERP